jgi:hypothetical protein
VKKSVDFDYKISHFWPFGLSDVPINRPIWMSFLSEMATLERKTELKKEGYSGILVFDWLVQSETCKISRKPSKQLSEIEDSHNYNR